MVAIEANIFLVWDWSATLMVLGISAQMVVDDPNRCLPISAT